MTIGDMIVESCLKDIPIANLYTPAKKAMVNPETGIKIVSPGARHVIRDMAATTVEFLPLRCLVGNREKVVEGIHGKVTRKQVSEFIEESGKTIGGTLLLKELLDMSGNIHAEDETSSSSNIYGSYGYGMSDDSTSILCKFLGAK